MDLGVVLSGPLTSQAIGTQFDYIIEVSNSGPSDAVDASFSQMLPSQFSYISTTLPNCVFMNSLLDCAISIVASDSISFNVTMVIPSDLLAEIMVMSSATITSTNENDLQTSNDMGEFSFDTMISHDLSVHFSANPSAIAGETLEFTASIANNGPSDARGIEFETMFDSALTVLMSDALCTDTLCSGNQKSSSGSQYLWTFT